GEKRRDMMEFPFFMYIRRGCMYIYEHNLGRMKPKGHMKGLCWYNNSRRKEKRKPFSCNDMVSTDLKIESYSLHAIQNASRSVEWLSDGWPCGFEAVSKH